MFPSRNAICSLVASALVSVLALASALYSPAATADDTEVYLNALGAAGGSRPNVLLIIDTSGSMDTLVESKAPYDPAVTYADVGCGSDRIYWRSGSTTANPPGCDDNDQWFVADANRCKASWNSLATTGQWIDERAGQWRPSSVQWRDLRSDQRTTTYPIECQDDRGVHGDTDASTNKYARNNAAKWGSSSQEINWGNRNDYNFYTSNYLNWYHYTDPAALTRMEIVQQVAVNLANSLSNVNLGLMRYSNNEFSFWAGDAAAEGGMVSHAIAPIEDSRDSIKAAVMSWSPGGYTPMSETMYEAGQYFKGAAVDYGLSSTEVSEGTIVQSVAASRKDSDQSKYQSPITAGCQTKNFIVFLTDGLPTRDTSAESTSRILNGDFQSVLGRDYCDGADGSGKCLDDMAEYLYQADLSSTIPGKQNVTSYFIGFGDEVGGDFGFLTEAATDGGGVAYPVANAEELTTALANIFGNIDEVNTTFTSPTVSINVFNRARNLDDLYVSVFQPTERVRWLGNLKKYQLHRNSTSGELEITGYSATAGEHPAAVDSATGFFKDDSWSFWSAAQDGADVSKGGAASKLPDPATRKLYTNFSSGDLATTANSVVKTNAAITATLVGASDDTQKDAVIDWVRGLDANDLDEDDSTTDSLEQMGDPIHSRPAVVTYGGTTADPDDQDTVVFVPTNDGMLHAIDGKTGVELWAFLPHELLGRLTMLHTNDFAADRSYGIDGDVRVLKYDVNQDGIITAADGDKIGLFFGLRRGGTSYYGLDVTDRDEPTLLWQKSDADSGFTHLGKAWSTPTVARVNVDGATQNDQKIVLVFGAGYDPDQDTPAYSTDSEGNGIFMVDAATGALLWSAGGPGSGATLELSTTNNASDMNNSIPGDVVVIDVDGDKFADRMYAADMGGRIWRFDITNGATAGNLVAGGVIARLGAGDSGSPTVAMNRRFYYAPDVSLVQRRGAKPYYNIAIGSGYRGHPLNAETQDRFYAVRDFNPFGRISQAGYDTLDVILDSELVDISASGATVDYESVGWKYPLKSGSSWIGEKILAESVTVNNVILVPSYTPPADVSSDSCTVPTGYNKIYAFRVDNGRAAVDFDEDGTIEGDELSDDLSQSGIAAELAIIIDRDGATDTNEGDGQAGESTPTVCISGVEVIRKCVAVGGTVRTYWNRTAN